MPDKNQNQNRTVTARDIFNAFEEKYTEAKIKAARDDPQKLADISRRLLRENSQLKAEKTERINLEQKLAKARDVSLGKSADIKPQIKSAGEKER